MRVFAGDACITAWKLLAGMGDESAHGNAPSVPDLWVDFRGAHSPQGPWIVAADVVSPADLRIICGNHCVWGRAESTHAAVRVAGSRGDVAFVSLSMALESDLCSGLYPAGIAGLPPVRGVAFLAAVFAEAVDLERVAGSEVVVLASDLALQLADFLRKKLHRTPATGADHVMVAPPVVLVLVAGYAIVKRDLAGESALGE